MPCEDHAREKIDALLEQAGWQIQNVKDANIQHGGLGRFHQLFGDETGTVLEQLNEVLAA
jgi:hypothetical protein